MKKFFQKSRIVNIDVFIYKMSVYKVFDIPKFEYVIDKKRHKNKWLYSIQDASKTVHKSYLFDSVYLLKSINKSGPVIGDCHTHKEYRGQAIYPFVINKIAKEVIETKGKEVYIVVDQNNLNSIKGIEKSGFSKLASIKAKRWLWFYLKRHILYFD